MVVSMLCHMYSIWSIFHAFTHFLIEIRKINDCYTETHSSGLEALLAIARVLLSMHYCAAYDKSPLIQRTQCIRAVEVLHTWVRTVRDKYRIYLNRSRTWSSVNEIVAARMHELDKVGVVTIASRARSLVLWQKTILALFYCKVGASLTIVSRLLEVQSSKISLLCCNFCGLHRQVSAQN